MSGGEVVCSGWLRKSPPEKKLRRYAFALEGRHLFGGVPAPASIWFLADLQNIPLDFGVTAKGCKLTC
ncbi:hypothetical protein BTVI_85088 [Pitangus sulphuratus]|nr:hypothetical protein BTVI_85088 [Pitangus sulphuratus]